jgi:hypothetical protein
MAGFAVVMTILMGAIIGVVGAVVLSVILFFAARRKLRGENRTDRRLLLMCAAAPFLGLAWLVVALLVHVQVSNRLAHQDCGLSGDPYVTLPNGYEVGSLNTYSGYLKAPGAKTDVPVAGPGYVRSIITLHLSGDVFTGTLFDFKTSSVQRFTFDTRTQAFQSALVGPSSWTSANDESQSGEESYWKIYAQYRHHWPNYVLLIMIVAGEGAIALWIWKAWSTKPFRSLEDQHNSFAP